MPRSTRSPRISQLSAEPTSQEVLDRVRAQKIRQALEALTAEIGAAYAEGLDVRFSVGSKLNPDESRTATIDMLIVSREVKL